jgi:hypothetical protein
MPKHWRVLNAESFPVRGAVLIANLRCMNNTLLFAAFVV